MQKDTNDSDDVPEYSEHFAHAVAASLYDPDVICESFGVSKGALDMLMRDEDFRQTLLRYQNEFVEKGMPIQTKAKMGVELLLPHLVRLAAKSETTGDAQKAMDTLAKLAGLYSTIDAARDGVSGFVLRIDLSAGVDNKAKDVVDIKSSVPSIDVSAAGME